MPHQLPSSSPQASHIQRATTCRAAAVQTLWAAVTETLGATGSGNGGPRGYSGNKPRGVADGWVAVAANTTTLDWDVVVAAATMAGKDWVLVTVTYARGWVVTMSMAAGCKVPPRCAISNGVEACGNRVDTTTYWKKARILFWIHKMGLTTTSSSSPPIPMMKSTTTEVEEKDDRIQDYGKVVEKGGGIQDCGETEENVSGIQDCREVEEKGSVRYVVAATWCTHILEGYSLLPRGVGSSFESSGLIPDLDDEGGDLIVDWSVDFVPMKMVHDGFALQG
uniref:Uncharacterized protein n=1 Tax=Oryza meridionalis TaxID=40149 RepID=A0A0E0CV65_9ORYZ